MKICYTINKDELTTILAKYFNITTNDIEVHISVDGSIPRVDINTDKELNVAISSPKYEAKWEYWAGWSGNHDKRIDDATCSKCGYKHGTIRHKNPSYLPDVCPRCHSKMDKGDGYNDHSKS